MFTPHTSIAAAIVIAAFAAAGPATASGAQDLRSPDARDAGASVGQDLRSPDARDATVAVVQTAPSVDLRSADARDGRHPVAPLSVSAPIEAGSADDGFDWPIALLVLGGGIALIAGARHIHRRPLGPLHG